MIEYAFEVFINPPRQLQHLRGIAPRFWEYAEINGLDSR